MNEVIKAKITCILLFKLGKMVISYTFMNRKYIFYFACVKFAYMKDKMETNDKVKF